MRTRLAVTLAAAAVVGGAGLALGAIPGADPTRTPTATPSPNAPTLTPVDGGANYYGQFSSSLPIDASFFPIGVWGAYDFTVANVAKDKDVGLNLYVWNADTSAWGQTNIANAGMFTFQLVDRQENIGAHTRGWLLTDEPDMNAGGPGSDTVNCTGGGGYDVMRQKASLVPDNRLTYANYGKGLVGPQWETGAQASCFVNRFQDITSADLYWHTDPNEGHRPQGGTSWGYGQTVDRMRYLDNLDGKRHPIWNFVEVGWPWGEDPASVGGAYISPAEIRGAVWHSIIAGARGIIYFQHSFGGACDTHHALRQTGSACYGAVIDAVRTVNAQIKNLAPVLNAPTVTSQTTTSSGVRAMYKWHDGHFYVFAGNRRNTSNPGTMGLSCVGDATAVKLGEDGEQIPVANGTFMDEFADGNSVHIYRIDGGSRCGL